MKQTDMVRRTIRNLHAVLATATAERAMQHARAGNIAEASRMLKATEEWLNIAGAHATEWKFRLPQ